MIKVVDKSKNKIYDSNNELIDSFVNYSSKNLDFDKPVTIELLDDERNAKNPLGMTAYYSPEEMKVVVYVTGRHLKDILRSISHELIHHVQNCRGDLDHTNDTKLGYAQRDSHMRDMETEAYNSGNIMNFRDFEDIYKQRKHKMSELQEGRLKKLNGLLMEQDTLGKIYEPVRSKIMDAEDLNLLARFIVDKADDTVLSKLELAVIFQGIKSAEKKGMLDNLKNILMKKTKKQKGGFAKGRFMPVYTPANDYKGDIVKGLSDTFFSAPLDRKKRNEIVRILSIAPAEAKPVDLGDIEQTAKVLMDLFKSQGKEVSPAQAKKLAATSKGKKLAASSKGPRKYRKCTGILRMGCGGDNIEVLQRKLHNVLKLKSNVDSFADKKFGPGTKRAVKAFQRAAKLGVDGVAGPNTLKALDAAVAGKLGIASPKGPAGDIDRLARPGSEIDKIFKQVVTDYSLVPQNERDPEYKRVRRQVMNNIRTELGSDKREEYLAGDKISRLKTAQKIRSFITQAMRG
jgi:peptidoglycan hydrolase-like protein with peptidoglycan-binding domain|tara:strand:+ start:1198 stop:2739 length:1542 start_codon:yes stop_codon:yes gene_type:complete